MADWHTKSVSDTHDSLVTGAAPAEGEAPTEKSTPEDEKKEEKAKDGCEDSKA